jgi:hypothetical protein
VSAREPYSVDFLSEGDVIVRGTDDPMQALAWAVGEMDDITHGDLIDGVQPGDEVDPVGVQDAADWCHDMLSRARVGYYRKAGCLPYSYGACSGWSWQLLYADGPGRGAFLGVYFEPKP